MPGLHELRAPIRTLRCVAVVDGEKEGVPAFNVGGMPVPLYFTDDVRVSDEQLHGIMRELAKQYGCEVRLLEFTERQVLWSVTP